MEKLISSYRLCLSQSYIFYSIFRYLDSNFDYIKLYIEPLVRYVFLQLKHCHYLLTLYQLKMYINKYEQILEFGYKS